MRIVPRAAPLHRRGERETFTTLAALHTWGGVGSRRLACMEPDGVARTVRELGGVARARQLIRRGASRKDLRRAVAADSVARLRDGVYVVPGDPDVVRAAHHGGALSCVSVLRRHGVWVLDDDPVLHVWVGPNGRVHDHEGCRCITHRDAGESAFGVVSLIRALVQTARCRGAECFFAAFESAWRRGLLTPADRAEVRRRLPAGRRWLVDIARPDADSGLESLLRLRLLRIGITVQCQVWVDRVGYVDFLVAGCLIIEADGKQNHDGPTKRHKDLVRDAEAAAQGFETLRFDYALVVHDWPRVEAAILGRIAVVRRRTA